MLSVVFGIEAFVGPLLSRVNSSLYLFFETGIVPGLSAFLFCCLLVTNSNVVSGILFFNFETEKFFL